ncbi:MAG: ASKHA domain-containing protein [Syntrophomonas sp.]|uniref:ASKHA domain-containing protein n=1 Tax=Syntrophomonas sp. TaxID=2053627 RepID=UPI00263785D0|nr:ASKHA domain-containing protein [Syntrophomonas sp.]MDD2511411.1 ASKHA domain-containing protein [Syntrophomonas sp.]MDD3878786.1 ASKHA domain-containing protein [Syntrophomonas sp.]MDD4627535.1 ASKHA domain-containing protein [Syntrophomonas sp.]
MAERTRITLKSPDGPPMEFWTLAGKNLWDSIMASGMVIGGACGGKGNCGQCKVRLEGEIDEISDSERQHLLPEELRTGTRLACFCRVKGPLTVYLDPLALAIQDQAWLKTDSPYSAFSASVKNRQILIPGMEKDCPVPLLKRLARALPGLKLELSVDNLNQLALIDRLGRPALELQALVCQEQAVKYIGRSREKACGLALDLGSTSLFGALLDLEDGEHLAISSKANMQRIYGADILSRVRHCLENPDGLERLQQILLNNLSSMIGEMLEETGLSPEHIYYLVLVGNPVMLHFFLGLNPAGFARAPYAGLFCDEFTYPAAGLGLPVNQKAEILLLPQVGGFVGADTVAAVLSLPDWRSSRFLLLDIGTNGEVVLGDRGKLWAASAAAGPAFEGGGISSGMIAGDGAIDKVFLNPEGGLEYNLIGESLARGLCGSAIIDIIACLWRAAYLDSNGIITELAGEKLRMRQGERGAEIILVEEKESFRSTPVVFNQEDIRQVQLAKAALRTAIDILMKEAGSGPEKLEKVYLAGAFGNYLDPRNALGIGLIPPLEEERIKNIGNAAASGAIAALLSQDKQREARAIKEQVQYVELALYPDFQSLYLNNLNFPLGAAGK